MKTCSICNQPKNEEEFNFRDKKQQIKYKHCKQCQKILRQASYEKNRDYFLEYEKTHTLLRRKERRQFIVEYKKNKPCTDCGCYYPHYVMDFDHLPQYEKKIAIASHGCYRSEATLLKEFAKCEIVCANCRRIRTWNRLHNN